MTHVTCRLTAKNRDQLRNPTLGNRVWATFTLFSYGPLYYSAWTVICKLWSDIEAEMGGDRQTRGHGPTTLAGLVSDVSVISATSWPLLQVT